MELIRREIKRLPKTVPYYGERVPNFLIEFLQKNQSDLEQAVEYWRLQPPPLPEEMPYIVTGKFLQNVGRQRTIWERVVCEPTKAD